MLAGKEDWMNAALSEQVSRRLGSGSVLLETRAVGTVFANANKWIRTTTVLSLSLAVCNCRGIITAMAMIPRRQVYTCQRVACRTLESS
jgi:hypothetical protein